MGRFIDCQTSITPWGSRVRFRRAKVGLTRKGSCVYLAVFFSANDNYKFPIEQRSVEIFPTTIRFKDLEKDFHIKQVSDEQRYDTMLREIKIILRRDSLRQSGKADVLDKLISSIPPITAINTCDLEPKRKSIRITTYAPISGNVGSTSGTDKGELISRTILDGRLEKRFENKDLERMDVSPLGFIPEQLWWQKSLRDLSLGKCNLTHVPKQLEAFSATLKSLDLSNNKITELPRTFCCKMNNLESLNLNYNLIETLPIEFKFFSKLDNFNISNNRLRMLPSTFSDLKSLRNLNVANNNLSQLPAFRKTEIRLKSLDVSYNPLDGASNVMETFEVHPSFDEPIGYYESLICPMNHTPTNKFPTLFEIAMLRIVRCDKLLKLASEESLPRTVVSTMQRDIFKCYKCSRLCILPAYNSTDILEYVDQVETLLGTGSYRHGMTFMKLLCRSCFDNMRS